MQKRHFQNCLSIEKKKFESNVKKYKSYMVNKAVRNKTIKIEQVEKIVESTVHEPQFEQIYSANSEKGCSRSTIEGMYSEDSEAEYVGIDGDDSNLDYSSSAIVEEIERADSQADLPSTSSEAKNEDILQMLKSINNRLQKIEETQINIMHNQSILSNGQITLVSNQQAIANKLEELDARIVAKPESMAQTKMLMECKVAIKKIESSVCRLTGEKIDKNLDKIASIFPLKTLEEMQDVEQKLESKEFCQSMITYMNKLKGTSEDVSTVIRSLLTDELLDKFNWEGRWGKQSLSKLMLFEKVLREVFQQQGSLEFERSIRKSVERSHHRLKQKKYIKNQIK